MIKRFSRLLVLEISAVAILLLSGCTTTVTPVDQTPGTPVAVEHVEVLYQQPQQPHDIIGLVTCDAVTIFASIPSVIEKCRKQSAMLGPDALIVVAAHDAGLDRPARVSGQAIKFRP